MSDEVPLVDPPPVVETGEEGDRERLPARFLNLAGFGGNPIIRVLLLTPSPPLGHSFSATSLE